MLKTSKISRHCHETHGNTELHPWPSVDHETPPPRFEHHNVVLEVAPVLEESREPRLNFIVFASLNQFLDFGNGRMLLLQMTDDVVQSHITEWAEM